MELTRRELLHSAAGAVAAPEPGGRPSVLFIMTDQHRFDCLGANGNKLIRTPNLDRLAAASVNFSNAIVQAPVCVPSRISFFTGRYPHSHRNRVNYTPCDRREIFLYSLLRDAGYQTGSVGKLHFYPPTAEHARSTGFDRVYLDDGVPYTDEFSDYVRWRKENDPHPEVQYRQVVKGFANPYRGGVPHKFTPTYWTGMQTVRLLREFCASPRPFFLFSSFFKPHSPHVVPPPYDPMYSEVEIPLPAKVTPEDIRKLPLPVQRQISQSPAWGLDRERLKWIYRSYYASVSMIDREVGLMLDELERSGRAANTIVIFTSDHGDQLGEHGMFEKNVFFEGSVRLPLLVRFPDRVRAGRYAELIETVDVMPTVLEWCGVPLPKGVQGCSFARLTAGDRASYKPRESAFAENVIPCVYARRNAAGSKRDFPFVPGAGVNGIRHPDAKMARTSRWKFNYYPGHGGELYDLANDPGETRNLYNETAPVVRELKGAILDWMTTADENDQIAERFML